MNQCTVFSKVGNENYVKKALLSRQAYMFLAMLAFTCLFAGCEDASLPRTLSVASTHTQQFTIAARPTLTVQGVFGAVNIQSGNEGGVTVVEEKRATDQAKLDAIQVNVTQNGNTIAVTVPPLSFPKEEIVLLTVTVPGGTDLMAKVTADKMEINGLNGQLEVENTGGTISASHIQGVAQFSLLRGVISVTDAKLHGQSYCRSNYGPLTFSGSLEPGGSYVLQTTGGLLDVTLPAASALHITILYDRATINRNDFGVGNVGGNPKADLTLSIESGFLTFRKS